MEGAPGQARVDKADDSYTTLGAEIMALSRTSVLNCFDDECLLCTIGRESKRCYSSSTSFSQNLDIGSDHGH